MFFLETRETGGQNRKDRPPVSQIEFIIEFVIGFITEFIIGFIIEFTIGFIILKHRLAPFINLLIMQSLYHGYDTACCIAVCLLRRRHVACLQAALYVISFPYRVYLKLYIRKAVIQDERE